ncbi:MAG: PorP/SprF family type IX secretion system membrane protein [Bacteroidia bacterium]
MRLSLIIFSVLLSLSTKAQDPQFTQYFSSPIYLNPAFAGYEGCSRISTAYRLQWPKIDGNYQTINFSYDQFVRQIMGSIAVNYQYDRAGDGTLQTHLAMFTYSPAFRLFKKKLLISPAIEAGWRSKLTDWSNYNFGWPIQPAEMRGKVNNFDINAALLITHGNFVYGVAFHHLTQPNESFIDSYTSKLPIKYTAHLSYVADIAEKVKISPSIFYQQQQEFQQFLPTLVFYAYGVKVGFGTRFNTNNTDALIFLLGYKGKWFSAGYSYDITVSNLGNSKTGGSHELNFIARFNCKNKAEKRKGVEQVNF